MPKNLWFLWTFLCVLSSFGIVAFKCTLSGYNGWTARCSQSTYSNGSVENAFTPAVSFARILYLNSTGIKELAHDVFDDMQKLLQLYLNDNKLEKIHPEWFRKSRELTIIDLSGNQIPKIGPNKFRYLTNIRKILLARNRILQFTSDESEDLSHAMVDLSWNPLLDVQIGQVHTLHLNHTDLEELYLRSGIVILYAEHSKIAKISIQDWSRVEMIHLRDNNLQDITNITANPTKFWYLDLSQNPIGTLSAATFLNMPHLRHLNMSGTLMLRLHYGMFTNQKDLKVLDISNNYMSHLYMNKFYPLLLDELYVHNNSIYKIKDDRNILQGISVLGIAGNSFDCETLFRIYVNNKQFSATNRIFTPPNLISETGDNIAGMECAQIIN